MGVRILEKSGAIRFLITLLNHGGSLPITELMYATKINSQTFYARKDEFLEKGIIKMEGKLIEKDGRVVKVTVISLTSAGQKIAKKLAELNKLVENL